jgi:hypothetical protein
MKGWLMIADSIAGFDFEVGHLHRSPCKTCGNRGQLPACIKGCLQLGMIQQRLTQAISCSRSVSEQETFALILPDRGV